MTTSIVLEVCRELKVHPDEFFGPGRTRRVTNARRVAIKKLQEAEFSNRGIARVIRRSYSTVQYWVHPKYRERRTRYYKNLRRKRKQELQS